MEGASGGAVGALIIGFQRALFSNEAGLGSAPIAHAAVQTKEPASEGIVSLLEPFIDTGNLFTHLLGDFNHRLPLRVNGIRFAGHCP